MTKRRVIVAGGRDFLGPRAESYVAKTLDALLYNSDIIVSGCADGADMLGERYAHLRDRKLETFPADWRRYGKSAGFIRNKLMADVAQVLIAFWDGRSKGTKNMIDVALERGLEVHVMRYGSSCYERFFYTEPEQKPKKGLIKVVDANGDARF